MLSAETLSGDSSVAFTASGRATGCQAQLPCAHPEALTPEVRVRSSLELLTPEGSVEPGPKSAACACISGWNETGKWEEEASFWLHIKETVQVTTMTVDLASPVGQWSLP